ncbi:MAG: NUDIX domain-containing protein, partial [[Clostridium] leptum]
GETGEDCAVRECREELGVEIQLQGLREETVYEYPDGLYGFVFYDGVIISGEPEKRVHLEIRWVSPEKLTDFSFCPADRPMVERLSRPI